jgi:hypothetical protein
MTRLGRKGLLGTNTLAYFTLLSAAKKSFVTLTAGRARGGLHHGALDRQDLQSQGHAQQGRAMIS